MRIRPGKYKYILIFLFMQMYINSAWSQTGEVESPSINYVTVDTSDQKVVLNWNPSTSPNIEKYIIHIVGFDQYGPYGTAVDSVSADTLFYKDRISTYKPHIYTVVAKNSIGDESLIGADYHKPVKLDISYDSCSQEMNLSWDNYIGWKGNLNGYRVLYREGSGAFQEIAILDTAKLSYTHTGLKENTFYEYVIRSFDNQSRFSFSNIKSYYTFMPPPPAYVNLDYVSVIADLTVEISFTTDLSGEIDDFRLMKASSSELAFTDWITVTDINDPTYTFTDHVFTGVVQAYYRIDALNSCLNPISSSNIGTNIVLTGRAEGSLSRLNWNLYTEYEGSLEGYTIYRMNSAGDYELIATLGPEHNSYIEDVSMIGQDRLKGKINYQVVAIEANNNPYGIKGHSRSNELTIAIETQLFVPNAFSPNGDEMNNTFEPVFDFAPEAYRMLIYDRSGKMLFQTTDPYMGWDGTLNGRSLARQGVYVYHIEYTSYSGVRKVLTGNVSLVNP